MGNESGIVEFLKREQERLMKEVRGVSAALAAFGEAFSKPGRGRDRLSAASRAKIVAAQKARWAEVRNGAGKEEVPANPQKKRKISAASRKKMAAAQQARWAKVRAAKKST